jgi:hypothetical protein
MHPSSKQYVLVTLILLTIEIGIALFVRDQWIRPLVGDALAVVLLYVFLRIFIA